MEQRASISSAILAALVVATGLAAPAARAQTDPAKPPPAAPPPAAPAKPPTAPPQQGGGTSAVVVDLSAIESVIGKSVKSSSGEDLGRIVDLLVTTSGQVRAAVIDFGGILGVGSRKVAVDWKALNFSTFTKDNTVRLALTRNQVRVSPEYKSGDPVVILEAGKPEEPKPAQPKPADTKPPETKPAGQDAKAPAAPAGEVSPPKAEEPK